MVFHTVVYANAVSAIPLSGYVIEEGRTRFPEHRQG